MKKILTILVCVLMYTIPSFAQHTTPRYGTAPNQDATFRGQKLQYHTKTDVASATTDTIKLYPNALMSHFALTLTDSVAIYASTLDAWVGDRFSITVSNTSGANHKVYLTSAGGATLPYEVGSGGLSLSPSSSKRAIIEFFFDGSKWLETNRMVQ